MHRNLPSLPQPVGSRVATRPVRVTSCPAPQKAVGRSWSPAPNRLPGRRPSPALLPTPLPRQQAQLPPQPTRSRISNPRSAALLIFRTLHHLTIPVRANGQQPSCPCIFGIRNSVPDRIVAIAYQRTVGNGRIHQPYRLGPPRHFRNVKPRGPVPDRHRPEPLDPAGRSADRSLDALARRKEPEHHRSLQRPGDPHAANRETHPGSFTDKC